MKLLELNNITKSYSGVQVLKGVTVDLSEGEVLCFVGENGAGKSTLIKIISGAIHYDSGELNIFGQKAENLSPNQVIKLGISTIYQEIDLIDSLTVADNIFLGQEVRTKIGTINRAYQEEKTRDLLNEYNLNIIHESSLISDLSTAQKQCVQIAKALMNNARILILDEPTASLGDKESKALLELVKDLSKRGIGIIYISHFIDELFEIGDKLLILKDGEQVAIRNKVETTPDQIIKDMIGRDAAGFYQRERFEHGSRVLKAVDYKNKNTVFDVSFDLRSGEIFGFGGLVGSGRTELCRMIYGADPKLNGKLYIDDKEITPKSPRDAINKGIFMISEDRKGEGIMGQRSVKENITITHNENKEYISLKAETFAVSESIERFSIKIPSQDAPITSLSGGNQQKALIARCVMDHGDIYIFDEPTKGVDVGAKEEIYQHIINLAKDDKFVIVISSDMPELLSISDRIGIMREGKLVNIVNATEATEDGLMREYLGV